MASGFTVNSLTDYVDQSSTKLIAAAQFKGVIAGDASVNTGVKGTQALQILTVGPIAADGSTCGFTASGSTSFSQRNITAKLVKYEDAFCLKDLEAKWTQLLLKKGTNYTEADFPAMIVDEVINFVVAKTATIDWRGTTGSVDAYLSRYQGILAVITGASGLITISGSASLHTNTLSEVRGIAQNAIMAVPQAYKGNSAFTFYCDPLYFDLYTIKLAADNLYHIPADGANASRTIKLENSAYTMKADNGLYGTGVVIGFDPSRNLYLGIDGTGEEESIKFWLDGSDMETVKYRIKFRRGWQFAIPSEVAYFVSA